MTNKNKYEPEDIEKLLRDKSFESLLEEEREFILNHIESEFEYRNMRSLLLNVENSDWDDIPEMDSSLRNDLISKHKNHHRKSIRIWLNTFFGFGSEKYRWYQAPGFQLAFATVLLVGVFFTFQNESELDKTLAETDIEVNEDIPLEVIKEREDNIEAGDLKKLEEVTQDIDNGDDTGDAGQSNDEEISLSFVNSNVIDNASVSFRDESHPDIDKFVLENNISDFAEDDEKANEQRETGQYDDLSLAEEEPADDIDEMLIDMNTDRDGAEVVAEELDQLVVDFEDESTMSNNGYTQLNKENAESAQAPQPILSEVAESSTSTARGNAKRKDESIKSKSRTGIALSQNPEIINQLFTSY